MSFLKQIEPYLNEINQTLKSGSRIEKTRLKEINVIYDELRVKESVTIYGRSKSLNDLPKEDLSCGTCVRKMLEQITLWHNKYLENDLVEFKGVPQKGMLEQIYSDEPTKVLDNPSIDKVAQIVSDLTWGEFKRYCSEQGLRVKGKKKAVLLKELEEIS